MSFLPRTSLLAMVMLVLAGCPGSANTQHAPIAFPNPQTNSDAWLAVEPAQLVAERAAFEHDVTTRLAGNYRVFASHFVLVTQDPGKWDMWRHFTGDQLEEERGCKQANNLKGMPYEAGYAFWTCPDQPKGYLIAVHLADAPVNPEGHTLMAYLALAPVT